MKPSWMASKARRVFYNRRWRRALLPGPLTLCKDGSPTVAGSHHYGIDSFQGAFLSGDDIGQRYGFTLDFTDTGHGQNRYPFSLNGAR